MFVAFLFGGQAVLEKGEEDDELSIGATLWHLDGNLWDFSELDIVCLCMSSPATHVRAPHVFLFSFVCKCLTSHSTCYTTCTGWGGCIFPGQNG